MANKRYTFNENKITAQVIDQTNNEIWLAFEQDDSGNCAFQKASIFDPNQTYYDIDIAVAEIKKIIIEDSYLYLAYNDSSLIGSKYSKTNPLTTSTDFSIPSGITEAPVDLKYYNNYIWYLIPGNLSGTNAKIVKLSTSGTFIETIDLATITNAKSFALDSLTDDFWVVTYTSPANLVRVHYEVSGWEYTTTILG